MIQTLDFSLFEWLHRNETIEFLLSNAPTSTCRWVCFFYLQRTAFVPDELNTHQTVANKSYRFQINKCYYTTNNQLTMKEYTANCRNDGARCLAFCVVLFCWTFLSNRICSWTIWEIDGDKKMRMNWNRRNKQRQLKFNTAIKTVKNWQTFTQINGQTQRIHENKHIFVRYGQV